MRSPFTEAKLNAAIEMAENYICSNLEIGTNSTTLYDNDNNIEVDVEVKCTADGKYDSGTYMIPPSWTGKIVNIPVSIIAWFIDPESDMIAERDITDLLKPHINIC